MLVHRFPAFRPSKGLSRQSVILGLIIIVGLLTGCERPDPQATEIAQPAETPEPTFTPLPPATAQPLQLFVVIVQPTPLVVEATQPAQPVAGFTQELPLSPTSSPTADFLDPTGVPSPTPLPDNYYLGWAWSDALEPKNDHVLASKDGLTLRDRPSSEGKQVGLVIGYADVIVAGESRCGYTPVLVHAHNLLNLDTPAPPIDQPLPLPTEAPPFLPTPTPQSQSIVGWVFTEQLTVVGPTAISGPLGVNLRSDPCRFGDNLGYIPAGTNMIVIGLPSGEYTPVRVNNDAIQLPFREILFDGEDLPDSPNVAPLSTTTPSATIPYQPEALETVVPTQTATITSTQIITGNVLPTPGLLTPTPLESP